MGHRIWHDTCFSNRGTEWRVFIVIFLSVHCQQRCVGTFWFKFMFSLRDNKSVLRSVMFCWIMWKKRHVARYHMAGSHDEFEEVAAFHCPDIVQHSMFVIRFNSSNVDCKQSGNLCCCKLTWFSTWTSNTNQFVSMRDCIWAQGSTQSIQLSFL